MAILHSDGQANALIDDLHKRISDTLSKVAASPQTIEVLQQNMDRYVGLVDQGTRAMRITDAKRVLEMEKMIREAVEKKLKSMFDKQLAAMTRPRPAPTSPTADTPAGAFPAPPVDPRTKAAADIYINETRKGKKVVFIDLTAKDPRKAAVDKVGNPVDISGISSAANAAANDITFVDVDGVEIIDLTGGEVAVPPGRGSNAAATAITPAAAAAASSAPRPVPARNAARLKKLQDLLTAADDIQRQRTRASDGSLLGSSGRGPPETEEPKAPKKLARLVKGSEEAKAYMAAIRAKKGQKRPLATV
jgi:hypothetical protein